MQGLLSFENAPPFGAPLRFFLTAPLFGVLAGLLALIDGPALFASRWAPEALAVTHLLTIGFMLHVMIGAMIQILPVVAGANLWRPLRVAQWVHAGLSLGGVGLASGFYFGMPEFLGLGAGILGLAVLGFLGIAAASLIGVASTSPTIHGIKLALFGLLGVVILGVVMALALAYGWPLSLPVLADLHAGWGLAGWAGVLLASVAYVVVPMFQLTPGYPARPSWAMPAVVIGLLVLWSGAVLADWPWLVRLCQLLAALTGAAFAVLTLRLQAKRRRARADATYRYWQIGLGASILALSMLAVAAVWPAASDLEGWVHGMGISLIVGGFMSLIIGMLYKIVPFLAWLHLQNCGKARVPAPAMTKLLPDVDAQRQLRLHTAALVLGLAAVFLPDWLSRPAGLVFALSNGWLFWNLLAAYRRYHQAGIDIARRLGGT